MDIIIPESLQTLGTYNSSVKIPKIIHQTYKSIEQLPTIWKSTPVEWKRFHPDWKYIFWSDDDCRELVKNKFSWFLKTYDSYEYNIQRADAIRPMVLYTYGGIYADCDIQPIKPFDDLFYKDYNLYLIRTPNNNVVTNCLMASKPKVDFWIQLLIEMKNVAHDPSPLWIGKHWTVMYTTGPMILNRVFNELESKLNVTFLAREMILPTECGTCVPKPCCTKLGYTRLLEGSSWVSYDTICYNFIMCSYPRILIIISLIFLLYHLYLYNSNITALQAPIE